MICCVPGSSPEPAHLEKREDPGDKVGSLFVLFSLARLRALQAGSFVSFLKTVTMERKEVILSQGDGLQNTEILAERIGAVCYIEVEGPRKK